MIAHRSDQLDTMSTSGLVICLFYINWQKSLAVSCFNVPFFTFLALRYFMAPIGGGGGIHWKTGSHNYSKIYSAMLKRVESIKRTLSIRHHYESVPKSILMLNMDFGILM